MSDDNKIWHRVSISLSLMRNSFVSMKEENSDQIVLVLLHLFRGLGISIPMAMKFLAKRQSMGGKQPEGILSAAFGNSALCSRGIFAKSK